MEGHLPIFSCAAVFAWCSKGVRSSHNWSYSLESRIVSIVSYAGRALAVARWSPFFSWRRVWYF